MIEFGRREIIRLNILIATREIAKFAMAGAGGASAEVRVGGEEGEKEGEGNIGEQDGVEEEEHLDPMAVVEPVYTRNR